MAQASSGHVDAAGLALEVATPLGMQLDLHVESVQVPSVSGELGVLPGHVPLLAALRPGVLRYRTGTTSAIAAVGAGFAEVNGKHVRVIAEFFERPEDIDVDEARKDLAKAEEHMKNVQGPAGGSEQIDAQRAVDWALARLNVTGH